MHKVWGTTEFLGDFGGNHIHRLTVEEGGYCSRHLHRGRINWLYVESGILQIEEWALGLECAPYVTTRHARNSMVVRPKVFHRFTALEPTHCLEMYWAEVDDDDIVRADVGGVPATLLSLCPDCGREKGTTGGCAFCERQRRALARAEGSANA